jgi:CRP/FNR family transcriptional regulator, cyclic AMP receptor protein
VEDTQKYKVWATDNMMYGPIGMATLSEWVQEGRVLPETWIHTESANCWHRAKDFTALREYFRDVTDTSYLPRASLVRREELRNFVHFAGFSDADLDQFLQFARPSEALPGQLLIKKDSPCDAAYLVVSGAMRVRLMVGLEDITLARISPGEFFGELGMFTQSRRTADVVAECQSRLLRISAEAFQLMIREMPRLAAPLLFAMAQFMAQRIANDNSKLQREVASSFLWR